MLGILLTLSIISIVLIFLYISLVNAERASEGKDLQITTKNIMEQVENLYNKQEYGILEILAKKYLERVPKHTGVRCYLAKTYYATNKTVAAIKECLKVLKLNRENDEIRLILANCYTKKNLSMEALKQYEILFKRGNKSVEVVKNMAELFNTVNQYTASIKLYNMLIPMTKNDSEIAEYKYILSQLNEKIGDYAAAFDAYKARIELMPTDIESRKKMTLLFLKISNHPMVISSLEELIVYPLPNEMQLWAYKLLVQMCRLTGEHNKALQYSQSLIDTPNCNVIEAKCTIADIYFALDNYDAAEEVLTSLINSSMEDVYNVISDLVMENSENIVVFSKLATTYENQGRYSEANDVYSGLLSVVPASDIRRIHHLMSNLYAHWGTDLIEKSDLSDVTEPFRLFSIAIQLDITNPYVHKQLAKANMLIKNYKEAISQLKIAMEYAQEADQTEYYLPLAECYHNINNAYEEKNTLTKLIKLQPTNSVAYWKLAQLCEAQHDVKGAKSMLEKTIELNDVMVEPKYRLALIYESEGLKEEAIQLYRQILKLTPNNNDVKNNLKTLLDFAYEIQE